MIFFDEKTEKSKKKKILNSIKLSLICMYRMKKNYEEYSIEENRRNRRIKRDLECSKTSLRNSFLLIPEKLRLNSLSFFHLPLSEISNNFGIEKSKMSC